MSKSKIIDSKMKIARNEDRYAKYDEVDGMTFKAKPKLNSYQRTKNKVELAKLRSKIDKMLDESKEID